MVTDKSKEAMKLALNKAFQLGQRYWSWADSEYSSHWKKADAAKAEFDQLVQDTINAALAEQPAQQQELVAKIISNLEPLLATKNQSWAYAENALLELLAATPQPAQRTWVGLTDEEAMQICVDCGCLSEDWLTLLDAIEAKLRSKNT